jgi:NitT/TauT family transport system permease protein
MMKPINLSKIQYLALSFSGLFLFFLIWFFLSYFQVVPGIFLPSPRQVSVAFLANMQSGTLPYDALVSFTRIVVGVGCSLLLALPLGLALGLSKRFEAFIEPLIAFIRYIPPAAFVPVAIIWVGIDETEKILVLLLGIAPYLSLVFANLVSQTRSEYVDVALTLGANKRQLLTRVIIPGILPNAWDILRITFGTAWTLVIMTEIVGANSGLGYLMIESGRYLRTDSVFAAIITIGFLGLMTDYFFKLMRPVLFPWTRKHA